MSKTPGQRFVESKAYRDLLTSGALARRQPKPIRKKLRKWIKEVRREAADITPIRNLLDGMR